MTFNRALSTLLLAFLLLAGLLSPMPQAEAAAWWDSYIAPEIAYADDLRQKVTLPDKVNINHADLAELETIPGLDQELALKMLRIRPIEGVKDFYRLPGVDKRRIDRLIMQLQPKVIFR